MKYLPLLLLFASNSFGQKEATRIASFIVLMLFKLVAFGQDSVPEGYVLIRAIPGNFDKVMKYKNPSNEEIDTLLQLGYFYQQKDRDTAMLLSERAVEVSLKMEEESRHADALCLKAETQVLSGNPLKGIKTYSEARKIYEKDNNLNKIAHIDMRLGQYYLNAQQLEESTRYFLSAIELRKKATNNDPRLLLEPLHGIAGVYYYMGNLQKSQLYLSEAIAISDTLNDYGWESALRTGQASILFEIANSYEAKADSFPQYQTLYRDSAQFYFDIGMTQGETGLKIAKESGIHNYILSAMGQLASFKNTVEAFHNINRQ